MAQGFKAKVQPGKQKSVAAENKKKGVMKKGARAIPPKKAVLVSQSTKKSKASSAHGAHFEELAASKAASKGKLSSIMKDVAARGDAMPAEQRAKGR